MLSPLSEGKPARLGTVGMDLLVAVELQKSKLGPTTWGSRWKRIADAVALVLEVMGKV
jgi:hypothetical protein